MTRPVLSREKAPASLVLSAIAQLCEARNAEVFPGLLADAAAAVLGTRQTFAILCNRSTGLPELASLCALENTPQVHGFLQNYGASQPNRGAGDVATELITAPGLWMIPVIYNSRTEAFVGALAGSADRPPSEQVHNLRVLARIAGPCIAALRDASGLRRKADELEALLQIKSSMLSHLSHELRSLLAAVRGYAKRMADGRAGALGDAAHHHLDVILRNTGKLLDLASHTLPFVAEQALRIEPFDLREPLESALKRLRRGEPEKFGPITLQIPAESFPVTADRERLAVVFGILLTAATGVAGGGARVTVRFLRGVNGEVTVKIFAGRDLPQTLMDNIFEHHEESPPSALASESPVAPGLALVHDMIWLHGGRITATNCPGEGAVFLFTLPPAQLGLKGANDN